MIIKGARVRISGKVAGETIAHLLHGEANETVRIVQGTIADVHDMVKDARQRARIFAFRHFIISSEPATSTTAMLAVLSDLGREFLFDPSAAFVVEHQKLRAGQTDPIGHLHAIVPEIDVTTGKVLSSSNSYLRHERVAREAEYRLGHAFVRGAHHVAVLAALRGSGKIAIADSLDRTFPNADQADRPRAAYSDAAHAAASRAGLDLPAARRAVADAWQSTTTRPAFEAELKGRGLKVRSGDKFGTWVIEGPEGTFVGSLARLARARKADVTSRMEKPDVDYAQPDPNASDGRGSDIQDGPRDPAGGPPAGDPHSTRRWYGVGDRDDGAAPLDARGVGRRSGAEQSTDGIDHRATRNACCGEATAGNSPLMRSAVPAILLTLARPEFSSRFISLQAAAYVGAKDARAHAFDELTRIQEQAEHAQQMADRPIRPSTEVMSAEEAAQQAGREADRARREAEMAGIVLINHRAIRPRGWRWLLGWMTGSNARHSAGQIRAERVASAAKAQSDTADVNHRKAARHATLTAESYRKWEQDDRRYWTRQAAVALHHRNAADKALLLLERWPRLAHMGPRGLLRLGERQIMREKRSDPVAVLRPVNDFGPSGV